MNNFAALDAQSAESRLAQMTSDEVEECNAWFDWCLYGFENDLSAEPATPATGKPVARASR